MAKIVVMGAGIGGISQVYELRREFGDSHEILLIGDSDFFEFTPSNPWVAVGWRKPKQIKVSLPKVMKKFGIGFTGVGVRRLFPEDNQLELNDDRTIDYDYLVIATGPMLAFDEVPGLGPDRGHTQSVCKNGVGDTKSLMESELRDRHILWTCNAKITEITEGNVKFTEVDEDGNDKKEHELPFKHSMILPAFKGVNAVDSIEGLTNPRGFILIDDYQRNPKYQNIYAVGGCVAIPPVGPTPVATGAPKTGYMIESMVTATTHNIGHAIDGEEPEARGSWSAVCLADFGDTGVAFVALPQIPPRNTNWASRGKWIHVAKVAYDKYFLHKVRTAKAEPYYEKMILKMLGAERLKESR